MKITVLIFEKNAAIVSAALGTTPKRFPSLKTARVWLHNAGLFVSAKTRQAQDAGVLLVDGHGHN